MSDKSEQLSFDLSEFEEDWKKEWKDMPEFSQDDASPFRTIEMKFKSFFNKKGYWIDDRVIKIHFEDNKAIQDFRELLKIKGLTHATKYFEFDGSIKKFCQLVNQNMTELTKYIWYPEIDSDKPSDWRYIDES